MNNYYSAFLDDDLIIMILRYLRLLPKDLKILIIDKIIDNIVNEEIADIHNYEYAGIHDYDNYDYVYCSYADYDSDSYNTD